MTDYDVDGTTSASSSRAHSDSSALVIDWTTIPDRFLEGYGFSVIAAEKAADDGIELISADIGVRDHAAVSCAAERGSGCDHL